ncbi:MAG TPA: hypothetical protein VFH61_06390 [Thermoleophilia bacterium]|nr:hypothetical protein [Thermoleophilia bacterium]
MADGWNEYRVLVTSEIRRLHSWIEAVDERERDDARLRKMETQLAVLQTKAALWGSLGGLIVGGGVAAAMKAFGG